MCESSFPTVKASLLSSLLSYWAPPISFFKKFFNFILEYSWFTMWCHKLLLQSWLTLEISWHLFSARSHLPAWEFWDILSSALKSPTAVASDFKDNDQRFLSELKHQEIKKFLPLEGHEDFFGKIVTGQYSFQTSFLGELMNWINLSPSCSCF